MALMLRNTLASSGAAGQEQWTQRVMIFHSTHASGLPLSAGPLLGSLEEKKSKKDQENPALALRSLLPSRYHRQVAGGALMGLTHRPDSPPKIGVCDPMFSLISLAYSLNLSRRAEISS